MQETTTVITDDSGGQPRHQPAPAGHVQGVFQCGVIVRKGKLGEGPANLLETGDLQQTNKPAAISSSCTRSGEVRSTNKRTSLLECQAAAPATSGQSAVILFCARTDEVEQNVNHLLSDFGAPRSLPRGPGAGRGRRVTCLREEVLGSAYNQVREEVLGPRASLRQVSRGEGGSLLTYLTRKSPVSPGQRSYPYTTGRAFVLLASDQTKYVLHDSHYLTHTLTGFRRDTDAIPHLSTKSKTIRYVLTRSLFIVLKYLTITDLWRGALPRAD